MVVDCGDLPSGVAVDLGGTKIAATRVLEGKISHVVRAKTDTAGAAVYRITISNNAKPADFLASFTLFTVKNLTITCGNPAVPTIKASVIANTSIIDFDPSVYSAKPKSVLKPSNLSNK